MIFFALFGDINNSYFLNKKLLYYTYQRGDGMSVKLVETVRANTIESTHFGSIAVVGSDGTLMHSLGNADRLTYFHSSAKPIQGIASLEAGIVEKFGLDLKEIALIVSSHSGESEHIKVLKGIMEKTGIAEDIMECGIVEPVNKEVLKELYAAGLTMNILHGNCSGKHLGMIAASKVKGFPMEDYHKGDHPMQKLVKQVVSDFSAINPDNIAEGIDGCTVPVYAVPLKNMAFAYANLCNMSFMEGKYAKSQNYIISAMTMYPEMVAGKKRIDTELMKRFGSRIIVKIGAEGVFCVGILGKNIGIALKIEDGTSIAVGPAIIEVLLQLKVLNHDETEVLKEFWRPQLLNNKKEVIGEIRPVFKLN